MSDLLPNSVVTMNFGSWGLGFLGLTGQARGSLQDASIEYRVQATFLGLSVRYTTNSNTDNQTLDIGLGFVLGVGTGANGFAGLSANYGEAVAGGGNFGVTASVSGTLLPPVGLSGGGRLDFGLPSPVPSFNSRYQFVNGMHGTEVNSWDIRAAPNPLYYPSDDPYGPFTPQQIGGTNAGKIALGIAINAQDYSPVVGRDGFNSPNPADWPTYIRSATDNPYGSSSPQIGGTDAAKIALGIAINAPGYTPFLGQNSFSSPNPADRGGAAAPAGIAGTAGAGRGSDPMPAYYRDSASPIYNPVKDPVNTELKNFNSHNSGLGKSSDSDSGAAVFASRPDNGAAMNSGGGGGNNNSGSYFSDLGGGTRNTNTNTVSPTKTYGSRGGGGADSGASNTSKPTRSAGSSAATGSDNDPTHTNGTSFGGPRPILLDLDGEDGVEITELSRSNIFMDGDDDGLSSRTAWAGVGKTMMWWTALACGI